jgi:hypothetical protein
MEGFTRFSGVDMPRKLAFKAQHVRFAIARAAEYMFWSDFASTSKIV